LRDYSTSQANIETACDSIDTLTTTNDDVFIVLMSDGASQELECGSDTLTRTDLMMLLMIFLVVI